MLFRSRLDNEFLVGDLIWIALDTATLGLASPVTLRKTLVRLAVTVSIHFSKIIL